MMGKEIIGTILENLSYKKICETNFRDLVMNNKEIFYDTNNMDVYELLYKIFVAHFEEIKLLTGPTRIIYSKQDACALTKYAACGIMNSEKQKEVFEKYFYGC